MLFLDLIEEWLVILSVKVIFIFFIEWWVRSLWTSFFSKDCLSYFYLESSLFQLIIIILNVIVLSSSWVSLMRCKRLQDDFLPLEVIRVQRHSIFFHWIPDVRFVQSFISWSQSCSLRHYHRRKWFCVHPLIRRRCLHVPFLCYFIVIFDTLSHNCIVWERHLVFLCTFSVRFHFCFRSRRRVLQELKILIVVKMLVSTLCTFSIRASYIECFVSFCSDSSVRWFRISTQMMIKNRTILLTCCSFALSFCF